MRAFVPVFEETVLPHLDAAYNLARWLARNDKDAEDVVQEACLRALRHFSSFRGGDARPWFLTIVRNTYFTWIKHNRIPKADAVFDEETHPQVVDPTDPEVLLLKKSNRQMVRRAIRRLPAEFLEVIVLREFEELSYKQIADIVQIPCGTVMSRLARGRSRLAQILLNSNERSETSVT